MMATTVTVSRVVADRKEAEPINETFHDKKKKKKKDSLLCTSSSSSRGERTDRVVFMYVCMQYVPRGYQREWAI